MSLQRMYQFSQNASDGIGLFLARLVYWLIQALTAAMPWMPLGIRTLVDLAYDDHVRLIAPGGDSTYSPIISVNVGSTAASWSLYPNPATSTVTIQSAAATPSTPSAPAVSIAGIATAAPFLLYDAQGKFLRTLAVGANDISTLVPGMYIVRSQEKTMIFMKQ